MVELVTDDTLSLRPLEGENATQSELLRAKRPTGHRVTGLVLEGAWAAGPAALVAATMDVLHEDSLHFTLIDFDSDWVEEVALPHPYTTGSFEEPVVRGLQLTFNFFGETRWSLEVLETARLHIPLFGDARGVSRAPRLWTRLIVEGYPRPEHTSA